MKMNSISIFDILIIMKLIVGLGNPGSQYNFTRHNVGFLALDFYFKVKGFKWEKQPKFGAVWARIDDTFFVKPQDYYNESGRAVKEFMRYYKIALVDVLVICDNFDLEFGKVRYRSEGAAAGNNGLKSVDQYLGTNEYPRIRVGTGNNELRRKIGDVEFVLSKFTAEEKEKLSEILSEVVNKIDSL